MLFIPCMFLNQYVIQKMHSVTHHLYRVLHVSALRFHPQEDIITRYISQRANVSLTECNICTTQKFPIGGNTKIELKNVPTTSTIPAHFSVKT